MFSTLKNEQNLTSIYKLINEMNIWEDFKTYENAYVFDGRFTAFFWECGKSDIDVDDSSLNIMKYIANNGCKDFIINYYKTNETSD